MPGTWLEAVFTGFRLFKRTISPGFTRRLRRVILPLILTDTCAGTVVAVASNSSATYSTCEEFGYPVAVTIGAFGLSFGTRPTAAASSASALAGGAKPNTARITNSPVAQRVFTSLPTRRRHLHIQCCVLLTARFLLPASI